MFLAIMSTFSRGRIPRILARPPFNVQTMQSILAAAAFVVDRSKSRPSNLRVRGGRTTPLHPVTTIEARCSCDQNSASQYVYVVAPAASML